MIEICRTKPDHRNKKRYDSHDDQKTYFFLFRPEIHLVFEFCEHDLAGLLANKHVQFTLAEKKKVIQQLLEGKWLHTLHVYYCQNEGYDSYFMTHIIILSNHFERIVLGSQK